MSDVAIRVENLGKLYPIGKPQERFPTLRDKLADAFTSPFRQLRSSFQRSNAATFQRSNDDYIWALKDVSFDVKHGEVIGTIGRNGYLNGAILGMKRAGRRRAGNHAAAQH
jgi:lipopolysaccharide transport system ATP-binding protein